MRRASGSMINPAYTRAGGIVLYAWILWIVLVTSLTNGSVAGAGLYLATAGAGVLGFILARLKPSLLATPEFSAGLLGISGYVLLSTVFRGGAGGVPLGYANANAALAMLLVVVSVIAFYATTDVFSRVMAGSAGAFSVVAVVATASQAGLVITSLLILGIVVLHRAVRPHPIFVRLWALTWVLLVVLSLAMIMMLTVRRLQGHPPVIFDDARYTLWTDALTLWSRHWVLGAGPGGFVEFSELAKDPDTARAHMSVLQVGAEFGVVGIALFLAAMVVVSTMLVSVRTRTSLVVLAGMAGLLLHSFVDYVLDFPVVTLAAGLALGWGIRTEKLEQFDVSEGERPG